MGERVHCVHERIAKKLSENSRRVLMKLSDGGRGVTFELGDHGLAWLGFQCAHITKLGDEVACWIDEHPEYKPAPAPWECEQPDVKAYAALLELPINGPRSTAALQSAMATLRDAIAERRGETPEEVQNRFEAIFKPADPS